MLRAGLVEGVNINNEGVNINNEGVNKQKLVNVSDILSLPGKFRPWFTIFVIVLINLVPGYFVH